MEGERERRREGRGDEKEGKGREKEGMVILPTMKSWIRHCFACI